MWLDVFRVIALTGKLGSSLDEFQRDSNTLLSSNTEDTARDGGDVGENPTESIHEERVRSAHRTFNPGD